MSFNENPTLDPNLKEELEELPTEDPFVTDYGAGAKDEKGRSIDFADKWFPKEENWQGKTNIAPIQAKNLALLRNLHLIFDELEDLEPFLKNLVTDYEQYLTSIEGESRKEQMKILTAMFGKPSEAEDMTKSALLSAFAQNGQGENNE